MRHLPVQAGSARSLCGGRDVRGARGGPPGVFQVLQLGFGTAELLPLLGTLLEMECVSRSLFWGLCSPAIAKPH